MGRDIGPKDKQSRRIGEKLFLKGERDFSAKSAIVKRPYPPGVHGPKGFGRKISEYGKQLMAKQKVKKMYRMREHQFYSYFKTAAKLKGDPNLNLLILLERRFDNTIYRLGLADSRDQARQLVTHGHFLVNGKRVKVPSYRVEIKDKISIREKSKTNGLLSLKLKEIKRKEIPEWLQYNEQDQTAQVIDMPHTQELNLDAAAILTVEFYSR